MAGSPCPACREAQIPLRPTQGQRGRGAVFLPPGILLVPGDPSPSPQKGKAVGMELNTPKQAHPRAMRSLTPCVPAGSPRHGLAEPRHTGTPREWPRPALCTDGHPHHSPQRCASSEGTDLPLVHHSPSRFLGTLVTPAALLSSFSILHQHTDRTSHKRKTLFSSFHSPSRSQRLPT